MQSQNLPVNSHIETYPVTHTVLLAEQRDDEYILIDTGIVLATEEYILIDDANQLK